MLRKARSAEPLPRSCDAREAEGVIADLGDRRITLLLLLSGYLPAAKVKYT
jgi:hypothetical protein